MDKKILIALSMMLFVNVSLFSQADPPEYMLVLDANPGGTVTGAGLYFSDSLNLIEIKAIADDGYLFSHWSNSNGDWISGMNPEWIYIFSDTLIIANFFEAGKYYVGVVGFNSTGSGYYYEGETTIITAIMPECYEFLNWYDSDGNIISDKNPLELTVVSNTTLYVNYEDLRYYVTVEAGEGGSISDTTLSLYGYYTCDSAITVEAYPNDGYVFLHWANNNGEVITTDNPYCATVSNNLQLIAKFSEDVNNINHSIVSKVNVAPNPTNNGTTLTFTLLTWHWLLNTCIELLSVKKQ